jgi:hypothetical protein
VKETFSAQFETVKQAILSCDFVAIDTELTGLSASKKARINSLDSVEERYVRAPPPPTLSFAAFGRCGRELKTANAPLQGKLRESASKFMVPGHLLLPVVGHAQLHPQLMLFANHVCRVCGCVMCVRACVDNTMGLVCVHEDL